MQKPQLDWSREILRQPLNNLGSLGAVKSTTDCRFSENTARRMTLRTEHGPQLDNLQAQLDGGVVTVGTDVMLLQLANVIWKAGMKPSIQA